MQREFVFANSYEIPWRKSKFAEGIFVKDLGSSNGETAQLVRLEAGARFPMHTHAGPEFVYVLSGEAIQRRKRLLPGWIGIAPTGTEEDDFWSEKGCTFLLVYTEE